MTPILMNNDIKLAKVLGSVALCLGTVQLLAPARINAKLGLGLPHWLMRLLGVREIASGFITLAHPDETPPVGIRLAGDALDLALLSKALLPGQKVTNPAILATVAVLGVTALDLAAGVSMRRRQATILETAQRTRYRPGAKPA